MQAANNRGFIVTVEPSIEGGVAPKSFVEALLKIADTRTTQVGITDKGLAMRTDTNSFLATNVADLHS